MTISTWSPARRPAAWFVTLALLGLGTGCRRSATTDQATAGLPPGVVRISPAELFVNDLKRLEPHLFMTSGCVRIESPDQEVFFGTEWELWESGKRVRSLGYGRQRVRKPDMASFTIEETTSPKGKRQHRFVDATSAANGGGSSRRLIDAPEPGEKGAMSGTAKLDGPRDLAAGEKVLVWAYAFDQDMKHPGGPAIEDVLARCRWALAVKVWWEPSKKDE